MKKKSTLRVSFQMGLKAAFLSLALLLGALCAQANIRYVDSAALGNNSGSSWVNAYIYLSDALAVAQADATIDTILVAKGTYYPTGAQSGVKRDSVFAILRNNLKIFGGFQSGGVSGWGGRELPTYSASGSVLSGDIGIQNDSSDNSYHVVAILAPSGDTIDVNGVVLDGFTVLGGNGFNAPGYMTLNGQGFNNHDGAGIYIGALATGTVTSPTIRHCLIEGNYADWGGGIYQANYGGLVSAVLDNCAISENVANGNGAAIFIQANPGQSVQSKPVIKNTLVADNMAGGSGGGVYFNNSIGHLTLNQVVFRNNEASSGGGFFHQSGKVTADSCAFYSNVATNGGGGGWFNQSDSAIISSVKFIANIGQNQNCNGGGFNNHGGNVVITNAVFKANRADTSYGGAWFNLDGKVVMVNALFSGNTADYGGAWFSERDSTQVITNATFAGNKAVAPGASGGAIRTSNNYTYLNIRLHNSILWGNSTEIDGTVSLSNTIVSGGGSGVLDMNPLFVMPVSFSMAPDTLGDYHLSQCSPAINIGSNDSIPSGILTDLDGNVRVFNIMVDLGAYEFQSIPEPNKTRFVDINASGSDDGSSWTNAFTDLQNAINHSCSGDTLWVAQGTYLPTRRADELYIVDSGHRDNAFVLRNGLKIFGGFDGTETQLSARDWVNNATILSGELQSDNDSTNNAFHVVIAYRTDSTTMLDGLTIQRGQSDSAGAVAVNSIPCYRDQGAGLYTSTSSSVFAHLMIQNNYANSGGAAINAIVNDDAIYKDLVIQDNTANDQGAGIRIYGGRAYVMHSTFRRNHCNSIGGGMFVVASGNAFVTDCTFEDNFAKEGGGIYKYDGYLEADRCCFRGNQALNVGNDGNGGGYCNVNGNFRITNSLFTGNVAGWGAALYYYYDTNVVSQVVNTTISGNKSVNTGGAIGTWGSVALPNSSFTNGIIWGNTKSVSGSINITNSIVEGGFISGTNILNADPLFVAPEPPSSAPDTLGDYHLQACSPAINIGINDSIPAGITTDLDSNARIFNTTVDLGAYEFQDSVPEYSAVYVDSANGNDGNDGASWATAFKTLSYALTVVQDTLTACYAHVDSILVAEGTYYPTGTQSDTGRSRPFAIFRAGLKIYGGFPSGGGTFAQRQLPASAAAGSVLSGDIGIAGDNTDNSRHVVIIVGIDAGTDSLILDGFRIQDGFANGTGSTFPKGESLTNSKGAGIYTSRIDTGAVVVLNHCVITNNNAESHGGGIVANNSFFYLLNSSIAQNQSGDLGGGLYDAGGSNLVIRNCDFTANKAIKGGGIYNNTGSSPIIENCSILLNRADSVTTGNGGGGIYNADGSAALVINSTISGNIGNTGGGWYNASTATAKLYNVLLSGNRAISKGAAWYSEANDSVWLVNATIAGNHVNFNGGGSVYLNGTFNKVSLQNSIIWKNSSTLVGGLILAHSIVQNGANGGWDWNPQFMASAADSLSPDTLGNYRLSACSPALNAGDSVILPSWLTVDVDGQQRIFSTNVDLGAYEFQGNPYAQHVLFVDSSIAVSGDGSSWSSALQTLSEAFQKADDCSSVDSILVAKGTYFPTGAQTGTDRDAGFIFSRALKIYGGYAPGGSSRDVTSFPSILSGDIGVAGDTTDNSCHVMVLAGIDSTADSVVVDGLSMVSGVANGSGNITINGKSISQDKGGGLYISSVDDSLIVFRDCKLLSNYASAGGGGLYISGSEATFNRVMFAANRTETAGAGIYCYEAKPVLTNCLISGNKTYSGSTARVGGIQNTNNGEVVLINTTVSGNDSGGLRSTSTAMLELYNCLVYGNAGFGISGDTSVIFHSLVEGFSSSTNGNLPGTIDPLFVAPESASLAPSILGNYHVLPCSPTIDMGDNSILSSGNSLDLDRNSRIENTIVDLGAYEFQGTPGYPSDTSVEVLCFADSTLFRGAYYTNTGYFTDTVAQATGCDSLYVLNLSVLPPTDTLPLQTYDSCGQVTYGGQVFLSDTVLLNALSFTAATCDSTFQEIHIHVYHPDTIFLNDEICSGDTVFIATQAFSVTGQYQIVLTNNFGCDSIINLDLQVRPENHVLITNEICSGDTYLFGGADLSMSGTYTDTLSGASVSGCDSIVTLTLTVLPPPVVVEDTLSGCDSITYNGLTYWSSILLSDTLSKTLGCDSVYLKTHLIVFHSDTTQISLEICQGDTAFLGGQSFTASGNYQILLTTQNGCDSLVKMTLSVHPAYEVQDTVQLCPSALPFSFDGQSLTTSGNYTGNFSTVFGCDSIVHLSFTVVPDYQAFDTVIVCSADLPYTFGDQSLSLSGNYTDTFTAQSGCDSIMHLTLDIMPAAQSLSIDTGGCGQVLFEGNTYNQNIVLQDTLHNILGCDSLYRNVHIIVWSNSPEEVTIDSLDCEVVSFMGHSYYSDTTITQHFQNIYGCDSFVLNTRIHVLQGVRDTIEVAICQGSSYRFGGQEYTQSGIYSASYPYWNGCDSIVVLKLTVHELPEVRIYTEPRPLGYCIGDEITLEGRGASNYRWWTDYGKDYGSGDSAHVLLVKSQIVFFVEGTDESACVDTAKMLIDAGNCCQLFMPNAFTPNGDGRNDKFGAETNGHPNTFRIEIYNRYGQRIFVGFRAEDRWDGLINGQPAAMGEYYYRVSGTCTDNSPILEKGSFTLIR